VTRPSTLWIFSSLNLLQQLCSLLSFWKGTFFEGIAQGLKGLIPPTIFAVGLAKMLKDDRVLGEFFCSVTQPRDGARTKTPGNEEKTHQMCLPHSVSEANLLVQMLYKKGCAANLQ